MHRDNLVRKSDNIGSIVRHGCCGSMFDTKIDGTMSDVTRNISYCPGGVLGGGAIDALKFLLAILVTMLHLKPLENYNETFSFMLTNCYARIAVPTFFSISGFLLRGNLSRDNMVRQSKRLCTLYGAWTICYLPLIINSFIIDARYQKVNFFIKFIVFVRRFFFIYSWTPLWYILACCYCLPFIYLILKYIKLKTALQFALSVYIYMACSKDCYAWIGRKIIERITILNFIDTWLFKIGTIWKGISIGMLFILLGIYVYKRQKKYNESIIYNLLGLVISIILLRNEVRWHHAHGISDMSMMLSLIPCVYFIIMIFTKIQFKSDKSYKWLRNLSIMIYGLHGIIPTYIPTINNGIVNYILIMVLVIIMAGVLICLSKKRAFFWLKYLY